MTEKKVNGLYVTQIKESELSPEKIIQSFINEKVFRSKEFFKMRENVVKTAKNNNILIYKKMSKKSIFTSYIYGNRILHVYISAVIAARKQYNKFCNIDEVLKHFNFDIGTNQEYEFSSDQELIYMEKELLPQIIELEKKIYNEAGIILENYLRSQYNK